MNTYSGATDECSKHWPTKLRDDGSCPDCEEVNRTERPTVTYSAGWNFPGYLPESDPYVTEDWESARDYLEDEILRAMEDAEDEIYDDASSAIDDLAKLAHGATYLTYVDGYAYWIEVVT